MAFSNSTSWMRRKRILVVDDNQDGAESMAAVLRLHKHEVLVVFNGASAVKHAGLFKPQLVLLDIQMSGMDGYETCRVLRNILGTGVRLIAVTGLDGAEERQRTTEAGFDEHLVKPVELDVLKRALLV